MPEVKPKTLACGPPAGSHPGRAGGVLDSPQAAAQALVSLWNVTVVFAVALGLSCWADSGQGEWGLTVGHYESL